MGSFGQFPPGFGPMGGGQRPGQPMQQINVNPETLDDFHCPECDGVTFANAEKIKVLPGLISPNGEPGFIQAIVGKICTNCGWTASFQDIAVMCKNLLDAKNDPSKLKIVEVAPTGKVE